MEVDERTHSVGAHGGEYIAVELEGSIAGSGDEGGQPRVKGQLGPQPRVQLYVFDLQSFAWVGHYHAP